MNFNLTPLEWSVSIFVCLAIYIWTRHGRPPQWTADLRAERDLLRQLVPVISPSALEEPETMIASATTVHDPHPDRPPLPENYTIEDANTDLF